MEIGKQEREKYILSGGHVRPNLYTDKLYFDYNTLFINVLNCLLL